ncbi:PAAR domain-containing protein [Pseudomonas sp. NY15463]|uniref:PAAR domain-containing protein n=1 Tax=Pseudomonas sp. NY15463 TaxID=3400361 RepID=UPI003A8913FA
MPGHGAIRLGDTHSGGGRMIEANGVMIDGQAQCVLGDNAQCPLHVGIYPLVSGGDGSVLFEGQPLIFEPAELACGCQVFSTCTRGHAKA